MKKAEMAGFLNLKNPKEMFNALEKENFYTQISDGTGAITCSKLNVQAEVLYVDEVIEASIALIVLTTCLSEEVMLSVLKHVHSLEEFKNVKTIVGPYSLDLIKCAKQVFDADYVFSWFSAREVIKGFWTEEGLLKDESNILRLALTIPILPAKNVVEAAGDLLTAADNGLEGEEKFANKTRKFFVSMPKLISVGEGKPESYDSVNTMCRKVLDCSILKSKTLGELFGEIKILASKKKSKPILNKLKSVTSEISVKNKNVIHKMIYAPNKLSVLEATIQLGNEADKFTNVVKPKNNLKFVRESDFKSIFQEITRKPLKNEDGCKEQKPEKVCNKVLKDQSAYSDDDPDKVIELSDESNSSQNFVQLDYLEDSKPSQSIDQREHAFNLLKSCERFLSRSEGSSNPEDLNALRSVVLKEEQSESNTKRDLSTKGMFFRENKENEPSIKRKTPKKVLPKTDSSTQKVSENNPKNVRKKKIVPDTSSESDYLEESKPSQSIDQRENALNLLKSCESFLSRSDGSSNPEDLIALRSVILKEEKSESNTRRDLSTKGMLFRENKENEPSIKRKTPKKVLPKTDSSTQKVSANNPKNVRKKKIVPDASSESDYLEESKPSQSIDQRENALNLLKSCERFLSRSDGSSNPEDLNALRSVILKEDKSEFNTEKDVSTKGMLFRDNKEDEPSLKRKTTKKLLPKTDSSTRKVSATNAKNVRRKKIVLDISSETDESDFEKELEQDVTRRIIIGKMQEKKPVRRSPGKSDESDFEKELEQDVTRRIIIGKMQEKKPVRRSPGKSDLDTKLKKREPEGERRSFAEIGVQTEQSRRQVNQQIRAQNHRQHQQMNYFDRRSFSQNQRPWRQWNNRRNFKQFHHHEPRHFNNRYREYYRRPSTPAANYSDSDSSTPIKRFQYRSRSRSRSPHQR